MKAIGFSCLLLLELASARAWGSERAFASQPHSALPMRLRWDNVRTLLRRDWKAPWLAARQRKRNILILM